MDVRMGVVDGVGVAVGVGVGVGVPQFVIMPVLSQNWSMMSTCALNLIIAICELD